MIKTNLEFLMRQHGLNPHSLAKEAKGVNQPTLFRILSGESVDPRTATLEPLAEFFGVSVEDLRTRDLSGMLPGNVGKKPRPGEVWDAEDQLPGDYAFAPRMAIGIPCGDGKPVFELDEKGQRQAFRRTWLERIGANPSKIATVTADGNSMAPRILDQDSLVIDYSQKLLKDGKVFVIIYADEWYIKRVFKKPGGGLRIVSDNPDKARYPDWEIDPEQLEQVHVVAKVVALSGAVD